MSLITKNKNLSGVIRDIYKIFKDEKELDEIYIQTVEILVKFNPNWEKDLVEE